jgi:hypothetical protein
VAAPEVFFCHGALGLTHEGIVNFLESLHRQIPSGLTIGAGLVWRNRASVELTEALGLTNGFATGAAHLSDLPKKSPEDQTEIPEPITGMGAFVLLCQAKGRDPGTQEQFELVESGAGGGAEAMHLPGKRSLPGREIWCHVWQEPKLLVHSYSDRPEPS